jgi:soluble lytic murein transglycosylase-like protein
MSRFLCALLILFGILANVSANAEDAAALASPANSASQLPDVSPAASAVAASQPAQSEAARMQVHRISSLLMEKFGLARAKAEKITQAVIASASKYSLPPALVLAIISIESRFKEKAHGPHGATGLMQVVPAAHRRLVKNIDLTQADANIEAGSAILHGYIESAQGDVAAALKSYGGSTAYARKVSLRAVDFESSFSANSTDAASTGREAADETSAR